MGLAEYKAPAPKPVAAAKVTTGGNVEQIIRQAARRHGANEEQLVRIARCESNFNPSAVNYGYAENGNPTGLFQHLSGYWPARAAKYGYAGASIYDVTAQANVTAQMFRDGASNQWECR